MRRYDYVGKAGASPFLLNGVPQLPAIRGKARCVIHYMKGPNCRTVDEWWMVTGLESNATKKHDCQGQNPERLP